jgi:hypothetical protein
MKPASLIGGGNVPLFDRAKLIAAPELQTARLAICAPCQFNVGGMCKQCCGGVPIKTLVNLTASKCARGKW